MLVKDRYGSTDDAKQQLHNTIVELDGDMCHIERYDGWQYSVRRVVTEKKKRRWAKVTNTMDISEMDLNLQQFSLGFVNYRDNAIYLARKPLRKWKQGFYHEYLEAINPAQEQPRQVDPGRWPLKRKVGVEPFRIMHDQAMVDLYDDNYPSFQRAWVMVSLLGKKSVAWHRHWAFLRIDRANGRHMERQYDLSYKGKIVGQVIQGNVVLKHEFRYLTEPFVEAMIHASQG